MAKNDPFKLAENTFHGAGKTLDDAIKDAWAQAKNPGTFRVVDIYFSADNPIREYSVVINAGTGG
ncbi:MAG: hypothetical protein ACRDNM_11925 [Gaiellaceae bacterium]